jgi:hypothetical protein
METVAALRQGNPFSTDRTDFLTKFMARASDTPTLASETIEITERILH